MTALKLLPLWQDMIKMPSPPRRVLTRTEPLSLCRIEYLLNAAANTRGGFRLCGPDGLKDRKHVVGRNVINRYRPERSRINRQRHAPLCAMLFVTPCPFQRRNNLISNHPKARHLALSSPSSGNRVILRPTSHVPLLRALWPWQEILS